MPQVKATPEHLRPYIFHGLDLQWREGADHAEGECPWCGRVKFRVNIKTGQWDCKVCQEGTERGGGNVYTFLNLMWTKSDEKTNGESNLLAADRKLLRPDTLTSWGAAVSILTHDWLLPGRNADGKLTQLYRWVKDARKDRRTFFPTPELGHALHGVDLLDKGRKSILLCEGPWDGMALWEALRIAGDKSHNVLAVPNCGAVGAPMDKWLPLFQGRDVTLCFDNDHPKERGGKVSEGAGLAATRRAAVLLAPVCKSLKWLAWGKGLPDGWDVRDALAEGTTEEARKVRLTDLLSLASPLPEGLVKGAPAIVSAPDDLPECKSWKTLTNVWRKALRWTEGLDRSLAVMLACVTSTKAAGDQLWIKLIGPASSGKSTLCEALSTCKRFILAKSTIRGFHSGFKSDAKGIVDNSLVVLAKDKTLVTKDGDTLLQSPNLQQILAEARDLYDSTARTHYRHGLKRDYEGVRMTWILCGTASLRSIDESELGERFLDCVLMDGIDDDLEDEILWRVANRAERAVCCADGKADAGHDPEMADAMKLTGGYVAWLRNNAAELLAEVGMDDDAKRRCVSLGKLIAYMRARPSKRQQESAEREFAARLVSQMTRLCKCLAVVLNRKSVDAEVLRLAGRVALDTARGRTMELARKLMESGEAGAESRGLAVATGQSEFKEKELLRFLKRIGAVEMVQASKGGIQLRPKWRLTARLSNLMSLVEAD